MIEAMLAHEVGLSQLPTLLSDDRYAAEQKLDGHRVVVRLDKNGVAFFNRNARRYTKPMPASVTSAFAVTEKEWVFDGELVGERLWLFDVMCCINDDVTGSPWEERRKILQMAYPVYVTNTDAVRLVPTKRDTQAKLSLAKEVISMGGEGVVLKDRQSPYLPGARTTSWLKAKYVKTVDAVVMDKWRDGKQSVSVGLYDGGDLHEVGRVNMIGKGIDEVDVGDVIEVRYLYASEDSRLYQPHFERKREDKTPMECQFNQLRYVNREVIA